MPDYVAGRYAIGASPAAIGGSALIYKGADTERDMAPVAVKVFKIRTVEDQVLREHFNRELKALTSLRHPNVVELLDWGTDDGKQNPYIVLEWLVPDLFEAAKAGRFLDWPVLAPVALDVLKGLAAVQQTGTLHRDLKPENVLLAPDGTAKVADFGISKLQARFALPITFVDSGTPVYRPAEDDDGNFSLSRDVFAFGMLVIQVLNGLTLKNHDEARAALAVLDIPPPLKSWLSKAIATEPQQRPQSAAAALVQLEALVAADLLAATARPSMFLRVENRARSYVESHSALRGAAAVAAIETYLAHVALQKWSGTYELQALGDDFVYRLLFDKSKGQWAVTSATRLPPSLHGDRRARALQDAVQARVAVPPRVGLAQAEAEQLLALVQEAVERLQAEQQREHATGLFRSWRGQLDAKREVEDRRARRSATPRCGRLATSCTLLSLTSPRTSWLGSHAWCGRARVWRSPGRSRRWPTAWSSSGSTAAAWTCCGRRGGSSTTPSRRGTRSRSSSKRSMPSSMAGPCGPISASCSATSAARGYRPLRTSMRSCRIWTSRSGPPSREAWASTTCWP